MPPDDAEDEPNPPWWELFALALVMIALFAGWGWLSLR
jgi:hypothetical protein